MALTFLVLFKYDIKWGPISASEVFDDRYIEICQTANKARRETCYCIRIGLLWKICGKHRIVQATLIGFGIGMAEDRSPSLLPHGHIACNAKCDYVVKFKHNTLHVKIPDLRARREIMELLQPNFWGVAGPGFPPFSSPSPWSFPPWSNITYHTRVLFWKEIVMKIEY